MVCVLSADLSQIRYSTFVGGFEIDYGGRIILTGDNTIWMGGHTRSEDFPVSADAYRSELPGWESEYLMHLDMGIEFSAEDRRRISLPSLSLLVYPNPFNSTTTLSYWLPKSSSISLTVHDLLGRQVFQISNHLTLPGAHSILFDASGLSSGHYYTQITAGDQSIVKRLIHIK
jgi:hypothetical protein